ncbi:MAG: helix-turn-helix domain-containing protein [Leucobacter sp.]
MSTTETQPHETLEADVFSSQCTSRTALQHLTGRWGALVLVALHLGVEAMRFGEVRRRIEGISDRMLSQTLGDLERDGMVTRTVHSSIPPHVDYRLTNLGAKIAEPLASLVDLIESEVPSILEAQASYDAANPPAR